MLKNIRNRFMFLGVLTLLALFVSIPSLTKQLPEPLRKILPSEGIRLGLDLQGGMHLILKVNIPKAVKNQLELSMADLKEGLHKKKVLVERIEPLGSDRLRLYLQGLNNPDPVRKIIKQDFPNLMIFASSKEGGNQCLDLGLKPEEIQALRENAVDQTLEIIRNRIDQFGVTEPVIVRQGSDEIVVQLPGVKDPQRAIDLIGRTAQLEFKLVDSEAHLDLPELITRAIESKRLKEDFTHQELNRALRGNIPAGDEVYLLKEVDSRSGKPFPAPLLLKKKTLMTGEAIKAAQVQIDPSYNEPYVGLTFNARGARIFDRITGEHVGERLAIILDDVVQSAPVIRER
ncbi:MAG: protein translocase subunit SecDF, partial [Pseudomonadota bacterium]